MTPEEEQELTEHIDARWRSQIPSGSPKYFTDKHNQNK
jgi:hypothetical protein